MEEWVYRSTCSCLLSVAERVIPCVDYTSFYSVFSILGRVKLNCVFDIYIYIYITFLTSGVDVEIHIFLASALVGGDWSASRPRRFIPGEIAPDTHEIGSWVNPRAGLDDIEKRKFLTLPGLELLPFGRSVLSQSLYRLRKSTPPYTFIA
jgi:hypothetical protein